MKILLIMPNANIHALNLGKRKISFREAPLTLTTLAALIPKHLNATLSLVDESIEQVDWNKYLDHDLIAISVLTGTAKKAYAIADFFRNKGKKVVLGGVHVTMCPAEAKQNADSIVTGYAEKSWPTLLEDFSNGKLKEHYHQLESNEELLMGIPTARRDLQRKGGYMLSNTIMATRGCGHACDFCTIPVVLNGYYKRPIDEIIAEIKTLKGRRFSFNDVHLVQDIEWTKELLKKLIPLKKIWGGLSTFDIYKNKEIMTLLQQSGCRYLLVGIESISQVSLATIYKGFNKVDNYKEGMKVFHDYGILIQGCFVFGLDHDTKDVFKETVDWVNELKIDIPRYSLYTPYPGTKIHKRLIEEDRLLPVNYDLYDTQHVVFKPKLMTPEELFEGFRWAYKQTFSIRSIIRRTARASKDFPIAFVGNLAYRLYVRRLYSNPIQIEK